MNIIKKNKLKIKKIKIIYSTIHFLHSIIGIIGIFENNKTKTTRASRFTVDHHTGVRDRTKAFKRLTQRLTVHIPRQSSYKQFILLQFSSIFLQYFKSTTH